RSQARLTRKERQRNVRASFAVNRQARIKGQRILMVDDVLTTGATANECARELKAGGASEVRLLALAVAQPHGPDMV
ncbi:MAG: phosphoribosyltransferase family protein, partial [bacterium]|nr:phosphoribosyltransferase family protein [bacterium]